MPLLPPTAACPSQLIRLLRTSNPIKYLHLPARRLGQLYAETRRDNSLIQKQARHSPPPPPPASYSGRKNKLHSLPRQKRRGRIAEPSEVSITNGAPSPAPARGVTGCSGLSPPSGRRSGTAFLKQRGLGEMQVTLPQTRLHKGGSRAPVQTLELGPQRISKNFPIYQ